MQEKKEGNIVKEEDIYAILVMITLSSASLLAYGADHMGVFAGMAIFCFAATRIYTYVQQKRTYRILKALVWLGIAVMSWMYWMKEIADFQSVYRSGETLFLTLAYTLLSTLLLGITFWPKKRSTVTEGRRRCYFMPTAYEDKVEFTYLKIGAPCTLALLKKEWQDIVGKGPSESQTYRKLRLAYYVAVYESYIVSKKESVYGSDVQQEWYRTHQDKKLVQCRLLQEELNKI